MIYFLLTFVIGIYFSNKPRRGYYRHNDDVLYYQNAWYIFNDLTGWARLTDSDYEDNWYRDAYYGSSYAFDDTADEFEYSPYYQAPSRSSSSSSSSSRDNDYDYDWDSWDSSDTDWDSDW